MSLITETRPQTKTESKANFLTLFYLFFFLFFFGSVYLREWDISVYFFADCYILEYIRVIYLDVIIPFLEIGVDDNVAIKSIIVATNKNDSANK